MSRRSQSPETINAAALRLQREQTTVADERATERAIYFGLLYFTVLITNKQRSRYPRIDLDELTEKVLAQALTPMESLQNYGDIMRAARPQIEAMGRNFLIWHVEPNVTDKCKMDEALGWFATQFVSGVLLGQITDYLCLRDYYKEEEDR